MIPEGQYTARATEWDIGETKTGKPQIGIAFTILGGEFNGQSRTWFGLFGTGKAGKDGTPTDLSKRTIESMRYCGWTGDDISDLRGLDKNNVQIVIRHETYDGKTRDRIAFVNQLNRGLSLANPLDGARKAAIAAKLKGKCMSIPKSLADAPTVEPEDSLPHSDTNGFDDGYGSPDGDAVGGDDLSF